MRRRLAFRLFGSGALSIVLATSLGAVPTCRRFVLGRSGDDCFAVLLSQKNSAFRLGFNDEDTVEDYWYNPDLFGLGARGVEKYRPRSERAKARFMAYGATCNYPCHR